MVLVGCAMLVLPLLFFAVVGAIGLQWWPSPIITPLALFVWWRWVRSDSKVTRRP